MILFYLSIGLSWTPLPEDINSPSSLPQLARVCAERNIAVALPHTNARFVDKLVGEYIEPMCVQPTFLIHHPVCMSPLAKRHPTRPDVSERKKREEEEEREIEREREKEKINRIRCIYAFRINHSHLCKLFFTTENRPT